jgi:hypothetical protein
LSSNVIGVTSRRVTDAGRVGRAAENIIVNSDAMRDAQTSECCVVDSRRHRNVFDIEYVATGRVVVEQFRQRGFDGRN